MCRKDCLCCINFKEAENVSEKYEVMPGVISFRRKQIPSHCKVNNDAYSEFMEKYGSTPYHIIQKEGFEPNCDEFEEFASHKRLRKLREKIDKMLKKINK